MDLCHLCFEGSYQVKYNFQNDRNNKKLQKMFEKFFGFVLQVTLIYF